MKSGAVILWSCRLAGRLLRLALVGGCACLLLAAPGAFGQSYDSLRDHIASLPDDTSRVNALHQLIHKRLYESNYASTNDLREARQLSLRLGYDAGVARNYELQGLVYLQTGELDSAQYYFLNALSAYEALNEMLSIVLIYGHMGRIQVYRNNFDKAEEYFQKSLDNSANITDHDVLGKVNNNMAALHIRKGWNFKKEGLVSESREQFLLAVPFLNQAVRHCQAIGLERGIGVGYINLGIVQMELGNYTSSLDYMNQAMQKFEEQGIDGDLVDVYGYIGSVHELTGDYDSALYWTNKGLKLATELNDKHEVLAGYQRARTIYEKLVNYQMALRYQDLYDSTNAIMLDEQKQKTIDELEIKYESEKQESELAGKQAVIERQRWQLYTVLAICLVFIGFAYMVWRNSRKTRLLNQMLEEKSTELKKTAFEVLKKNAELNEVIQHQNNLMAIVAHDLRAPLSNLTGLLELMEMCGPLNKEQQDIQKKAIQASSDGLTLVEDIYSLRKQQVEAEPKMEEVDLNKLVAEVVKTHSPAAQTKQIGIKIEDLSGGQSNIVTTDRLIVVRILNNLISNAIKFSPPSKVIVVRYGLNEGKTHISIKDQGPGMTEEDKKNAFQRFKKLSARPTGGEGSSGLGLFIVKMLVDKLSGSITIESTQGEGATFVVDLPA